MVRGLNGKRRAMGEKGAGCEVHLAVAGESEGGRRITPTELKRVVTGTRRLLRRARAGRKG